MRDPNSAARWTRRGAAVALFGAMAGLASAQQVPIAGSGGPSAADAANGGPHPEALRLVDAWLDAQCAFRRIPALSAGVVHRQRLVWSQGYGAVDDAGRVAPDERTIYAIGSISKLFTSVALMQLVEEGRVRLDAPLTDYLPWATFRQTFPDSAPITLRAVLNHSAGLPREADFAYWTLPDYRFPTEAELRDTVARQSTIYPVGDRHQYSNLGLALIGHIVEAVAGEPFASVVEKRVLAPLRMADTRAGLPTERIGKQLARGYSGLDRTLQRTRTPLVDARAMLPAAGFSSTVADLARFIGWQLALLRSEKAGVLRPATLREMQTVQFIDAEDGVSFGIGFHVNPRPRGALIGHEGEFPGYRSSIRINPKRETGVVLLNNGLAVGQYAISIFDILDQRHGFAFSGEPPSMDVNLEDYAGRYSEQPWSPEGVMVPWAGGLAYLSTPTNDPAREIAVFKPKARDVFRRVRDGGDEAEEIRFERDARGRVARFWQHANAHVRIERVRPLRGGQSL